MLSNSIVDTGTNALFLAPDVLNAIGDGLNKLNPDFMKTIQAQRSRAMELHRQGSRSTSGRDQLHPDRRQQSGSETHLRAGNLLAGGHSAERKAVFQIIGNNERQSILGLPVMNTIHPYSTGRWIARHRSVRAHQNSQTEQHKISEKRAGVSPSAVFDLWRSLRLEPISNWVKL